MISRNEPYIQRRNKSEKQITNASDASDAIVKDELYSGETTVAWSILWCRSIFIVTSASCHPIGLVRGALPCLK
jgi:hypothetical protein